MPAPSKKNGPYTPLSATYYIDDDIIRAGEKAEVLYTRSLAFCASVMSDGYITDAQVIRIGVGLPGLTKRVESLVSTGLWERVEGGYQIRGWLKWNRSAAEMERVRSKDRERKQARSPVGFQTELDMESTRNTDRNPDGNDAEPPPESKPRAGAGARAHAGARAGAALHVTTRNGTTDHVSGSGTESGSGGNADTSAVTVGQLLTATGPWLTDVANSLTPTITEALTRGYTPDTIEAGLRDWRSRDNPRPGLLAYLIHDHGKPTNSTTHPKPAWCGQCDQRTRLLDTDAGLIRCTRCHPLTVGVSA